MREAVCVCLKALVKVLRHCFPKHLWGDVTFSLEDPAWTGLVLACMGILLPYYSDYTDTIRIHPLFEEQNVLWGEGGAKGRIFMAAVLVNGLRLLADRRVRLLLKRL